MLVRALEKIYYDKRDRLPGEEFEMDDRMSVEITALVAINKIERVGDASSDRASETPAQGASQGYQTAAERPEGDSPQEETSKEAEVGRRRYRRRDMRPQQ